MAAFHLQSFTRRLRLGYVPCTFLRLCNVVHTPYHDVCSFFPTYTPVHSERWISTHTRKDELTTRLGWKGRLPSAASLSRHGSSDNSFSQIAILFLPSVCIPILRTTRDFGESEHSQKIKNEAMFAAWATKTRQTFENATFAKRQAQRHMMYTPKIPRYLCYSNKSESM